MNVQGYRYFLSVFLLLLAGAGLAFHLRVPARAYHHLVSPRRAPVVPHTPEGGRESFPALLAYLDQDRTFYPYNLGPALRQALPAGGEPVLLSRLPGAGWEKARVILEALDRPGYWTEARAADVLAPMTTASGMDAALTFFTGRPWAERVAMDGYRHVAAGEPRAAIVNWLANRLNAARPAADGTWAVNIRTLVHSAAESDRDPRVRLAAWHRLHLAGEAGALGRLVKEWDRAADELGVSLSQSARLDWRTLREIRERFPESYLARGIAAYEAVRGRPYFVAQHAAASGVWCCPGDRFYDPRREIPGWEAFLKAFPQHPASDDAAYRLGRSYEQLRPFEGEDRFVPALNWLHRAMWLADGDMAEEARDRLIYVLDVVMGEYDLARVAGTPAGLDRDLVPLVEYSLAVKRLRSGRYAEARDALDRFLARRGAAGRLPAWIDRGRGMPGTFLERVWGQREAAARLAHLQARAERQRGLARAETLYRLGAVMYHDLYLFYNHLWSGGRQAYFARFINYGLAYGELRPYQERYLAEAINYAQALGEFNRLRLMHLPEALAERVDFSAAMALAHLDDYAAETDLASPRRRLQAAVEEGFRQFVARHPRSHLTDDALLVLARYTRDRRFLQAVLDRYPQGDMAPEARGLQAAWDTGGLPAGRPVLFLPYELLGVGDPALPERLRHEPRAVCPDPSPSRPCLFQREEFSGPAIWTYLFITVPKVPVGQRVAVDGVEDGGAKGVTVRLKVLPQPPVEWPNMRLPGSDAFVIRVAAPVRGTARVVLSALEGQGFHLHVPAGWAVWPGDGEGMAVLYDERGEEAGGLLTLGRTPDQPVETVLPNHSRILGRRAVNLNNGEAAVYLLERSQPAAAGDPRVWREQHALVAAGDRVYDLWVRVGEAATAEPVPALASLLEGLFWYRLTP